MRLGEMQRTIRARCGEPCARGGAEKQACPDGGHMTACWWECDIYGSKAVCYVDEVVMGIRAASEVAIPPPCAWSLK